MSFVGKDATGVNRNFSAEGDGGSAPFTPHRLAKNQLPAAGSITAADATVTSGSNSDSQVILLGTPDAGSSVSLALYGSASVAIQVGGTWNGTVVFEKSSDGGTTWFPLAVKPDGATGTVTSLTASDNKAYLFFAPVGGVTNVRVRCTARTSGTLAVVIQPGDGGLGGGGAVTVADGANVALGTTTDTPSTAVEDATARTGISLLKGIKNYVRTISGMVLSAGTAIIGKVGIDQTTPGTTNGVQVNAALPAGTNVIGRVAIDQTTPGTTNKVYITDLNAGSYETVAASQADQAMGATGATGDYLAGVLVIPGTTSPGAVSIKDGSGSAITIFTGGTDSVGGLVPFFVPLGIKSTAGAWKVTTGANVTAIGVGNFT